MCTAYITIRRWINDTKNRFEYTENVPTVCVYLIKTNFLPSFLVGSVLEEKKPSRTKFNDRRGQYLEYYVRIVSFDDDEMCTVSLWMGSLHLHILINYHFNFDFN